MENHLSLHKRLRVAVVSASAAQRAVLTALLCERHCVVIGAVGFDLAVLQLLNLQIDVLLVDFAQASDDDLLQLDRIVARSACPVLLNDADKLPAAGFAREYWARNLIEKLFEIANSPPLVARSEAGRVPLAAAPARLGLVIVASIPAQRRLLHVLMQYQGFGYLEEMDYNALFAAQTLTPSSLLLVDKQGLQLNERRALEQLCARKNLTLGLCDSATIPREQDRRARWSKAFSEQLREFHERRLSAVVVAKLGLLRKIKGRGNQDSPVMGPGRDIERKDKVDNFISKKDSAKSKSQAREKPPIPPAPVAGPPAVTPSTMMVEVVAEPPAAAPPPPVVPDSGSVLEGRPEPRWVQLLHALTEQPDLIGPMLQRLLIRIASGIITFALLFEAFAMGLSLGVIGVLIALRPLVALVMRPTLRKWLERYPPERVYVGSLGGKCAVALLFSMAIAPWQLFVLCVLQGLAMAAPGPKFAPLPVRAFADDEAAPAFASYRFVEEFGKPLGFLAAGGILAMTHDNFAWAYVFSAALIGLAGLLILSQLLGAKKTPDVTPAATVPDTLSLDGAVPVVLSAAAVGMVDGWFPLIAAQYGGLGSAEIGAIFALTAWAALFVVPSLERGAQYLGARLAWAIPMAGQVLASAIYLWGPLPLGIIAARCAEETSRVAQPIVQPLVARAGLGGRSRGMLAWESVRRVGSALGMILGGVLWERFGIGVLFAARMALAMAAGYETQRLSQQNK